MSEELPVGWSWASLDQLASTQSGSITDGPFGSKLKTAHYTDEGPRVVRLQNIKDGWFADEKAHISAGHYATLKKHQVLEGDLLIAALGENPPRSCIAPSWLGPAVVKADCIRVRLHESMSTSCMSAFLNSPPSRSAAKTIIHGVGRPRLNMGEIKSLRLPIPPAREQKRIASKIDELFSRIEEGERALEQVRKLVDRYRQSVLKAAVTGELTREWRAERQGQLESGQALLERILKARREAWEKAELEKLNAIGKTPTNDKWKQRYKEPAAPDTAELPELPEGWVWVTLEQLCFVDTGATPKRGNARYYEGGTIDWITSTAVNEPIIRSAAEKITEAAIRETNAKVFPSGSLVVAMYGEGKTRGKVSVLGIEAATNQACAALVSTHLHDAIKQYLQVYLEKNYVSLRSSAAGGVQPNLNLTILKNLAIPLPSSDEAPVIVDRVDSRASQVEAIISDFESLTKRSSAIRQSVLKSAFLGRLVPQDLADEPASVLLERIAAERSAQPASPRRGRKKKTETA